MGSSNMIELRDLVGKARRVYAPSRFLSPAQIMAASRAPRLKLSPNGAFVNQPIDISNNHYTGILGGSQMSDLAGDLETWARMGTLTIDQAYENQQQALALAQQAQQQRDAYAAKVKQAQQQVLDMQNQVAASQAAQAAQQAQAQQDMLAQAAQVDTSTRLLAYREQQKLEQQRQQFIQDSQSQSIAQSVRNRGLDAAMWQQRQQDEILSNAQKMAALQAAAGAPSSPTALTPAQPTLVSPTMPSFSATPSTNLAPEGGHPIVDLNAQMAPQQGPYNANPDAAGPSFAPNWDSSTGGQLVPDETSGDGSLGDYFGNGGNFQKMFTPRSVAIGVGVVALLLLARHSLKS